MILKLTLEEALRGACWRFYEFQHERAAKGQPINEPRDEFEYYAGVVTGLQIAMQIKGLGDIAKRIEEDVQRMIHRDPKLAEARLKPAWGAMIRDNTHFEIEYPYGEEVNDEGNSEGQTDL